MKIAFPVEQKKGLESLVYSHFGSAPHFIIVDSESGAFEGIQNVDFIHQHGQCQPTKALGGNAVDAVVVGGIGGGALNKLQSGGIKVYRAVDGSVNDNLALLKAGRLPEFLMAMTCAGHQHEGGCHHH